MTDWVKHAHKQRCEGKRGYRSASQADEDAQKASKKLGALILSYECCDCGLWHIGHADKSQIATRWQAIKLRVVEVPCQENVPRPVDREFCARCGKFIPEDRYQELLISGGDVWTCSSLCARRRKSSNRQRLRRERVHLESKIDISQGASKRDLLDGDVGS